MPAMVPFMVFAVFACSIMSAQAKGDDEPSADVHESAINSIRSSDKIHADGVYVDSLRSNQVAGKALGDGFVDIYIYGPNTGNHVERDGPGGLIFHQENVVVKNKQWSVPISPALRETERAAYYQININQTWEQGHTESEHAQDALNLFRVNDGPDCGTEMSAIFEKDTLQDAGENKSLLGIDGYACNTSSITMVISGDKGEVLKTTTKVVNGEWEAGKDMSIDTGNYMVQIYGENGRKLVQGNIVAPKNSGTIDAGSLKQSVSSKDGCFITGNASVRVVACLLPSAYTGSTDFTTLVHLKRSFQRANQRIDVEPDLATASEAPKFRIRVNAGGPTGLEPGEYRLLLMEATAAHEVLATEPFTLTP